MPVLDLKSRVLKLDDFLSNVFFLNIVRVKYPVFKSWTLKKGAVFHILANCLFPLCTAQ